MAVIDESEVADLPVRSHHRDLSAAAAAFQMRRPPMSSGEESGLEAVGGGDGFKKEMRDLEELLSKLNPMAEEFVPPPSITVGDFFSSVANPFGAQRNDIVIGGVNGSFGRKNNGHIQGRRRINIWCSRTM